MSPVLLAAYDSAHPSAGGDYWVWSHHEVLADLRNCVYYNFLAKALPEERGEMGPGNCVGGYAQFTDDWGCWYRFFDGGRDQFNRIGRFVICCGFIQRRDDARRDCSSILDSAPFREVAALAWSSKPIFPPRSLEFTIIPEPIIEVPDAVGRLLRGEEITVEGIDALHLAGQIVGSMPRTARWHLKFQSRGDSVAKFAASLLPRKEPAPNLRSGSPQVSVAKPPQYTGSRLQFGRSVWLLIILVLFLVLVAVWTWHHRMKGHEKPEPSQVKYVLDVLIRAIRKKAAP